MGKKWLQIIALFQLIIIVGGIYIGNSAKSYMGLSECNNTNHPITETLQDQALTQQIPDNPVEERCNRESYYKEFSHVQMPSDFKAEVLLYDYIEYGVSNYCRDKGIQEVFYCDANEFGRPRYNNEVEVIEGEAYQIDLAKKIIPELEQNIYQLILYGEKETLYMKIDTYRMKIYIYNMADIMVFEGDRYGNPQEILMIDYIEDGTCVYQDKFVKSDWNETEIPSYDSYYDVAETPHIVVTDKMKMWGYASQIAYAVERFCEENAIEEQFVFDPEQDCIGRPLAGTCVDEVYTARATSENRVIYIDVDQIYNKIHVYEAEVDGTCSRADEKEHWEKNDRRDGYEAYTYLDIPRNLQTEMLLYEYIEYGLSIYCGTDEWHETFYCDINEFIRPRYDNSWEVDVDNICEIDLARGITPELKQNIYQFEIEGEKNNLYMQIDTYRMKIKIINKDKIKTRENVKAINPYEQLRTVESEAKEKGFQDDYVISDWNDIPTDMKQSNFAAEPYLKITDKMIAYGYDDYVPYAVARYCKENDIRDTFEFYPDKDIIAIPTYHVYTVRVTGKNTMLYIDVDENHNSIHVYEVEH